MILARLAPYLSVILHGSECDTRMLERNRVADRTLGRATTYESANACITSKCSDQVAMEIDFSLGQYMDIDFL